MFTGLPPFFNFSPNSNQTETPAFAGIPLVNSLLNDAQTNFETLDERIAQLESVAQWLNMNLQMVNASVQQLQVQKQTLLALSEWQKLSKDALDQMSSLHQTKTEEPKTVKGKKAATQQSAETSTAFEQMAQAWWQGLQNQFTQLAQPIVEAEVKAETPKKTTSRTRKPKVS